MKKNLNFRSYFALALSAGIMTIVSACYNNTGTSGKASSTTSSSKSATSAGTTTPTTTTSGVKFQLTNAVVEYPNGASGASGSTGASQATFKMIFNANQVSTTLSSVCQVQSTGQNNDPAKACKCKYSWVQTNLSNTSAITRTITTSPTQITSFQAICPAPDVYDMTDEIPDGTKIKISLIPDSVAGNASSFTTNVLEYTKSPSTATGDFRDSEGRAYKNIFHYVCYDKFSKGLSIAHRVATAATNPQTNQAISLPVANDFVVSSATAGSSFSGMSYYYDFYVRSNELGSANSGNANFTCPQVNINGLPLFYPSDSTFALALQKSKDFPNEITSRTVLATSSTNPATSAPVLGYAASPQADGSCPAFTNSAGRLLRTFRLRRYTAVYPIRYRGDGDVADQQQNSNTVFVIDRPVDKLSQDPTKPLTRLGPKPCPFSFKTAQFGQKCTTDATLAGWNIDGTQIAGDPTCPVYPPVTKKWAGDPKVKDDGTVVIRPYKPFLLHYLEDTSFRACAFQSSTPVDPEIVLSHDDNVYSTTVGPNDFYCARHYPPAGAIIPPSNGDPFDKPPGDCDLSATAAAIKTDKSYACSRAFDPTNSVKITPSAGCCQICSGPDCRAAGGGTTAAARNAAFSPPSTTNPPQGMKTLPRSSPNAGSGCYDPYED